MMLAQKNQLFFKEVKKNFSWTAWIKRSRKNKNFETAQLNFRLVSENSEFGTDELISENGDTLS